MSLKISVDKVTIKIVLKAIPYICIYKVYKGETQMRAIFIATGAYGKEVRTGV